MRSGIIGKFAVAFVEYGDTCDGFPGILGVYDTLAEAEQEMLADICDSKSKCDGYYETTHTTTTGELWYDKDKTHGCQWEVIEV